MIYFMLSVHFVHVIHFMLFARSTRVIHSLRSCYLFASLASFAARYYQITTEYLLNYYRITTECLRLESAKSNLFELCRA